MARFSETELLNTKCVLGFPLQLLSATFLILRRNQRNQKRTWIFSTDFFGGKKLLRYQISWKPVCCEPSSKHDETKIVAFRNFANYPKNCKKKEREREKIRHVSSDPSHYWNTYNVLHVCTVQQQYQGTFLLFQNDAHNYKIIGILKQLKFRLPQRHVSVHAGTIIRKLLRV
jgi:hypothetical protein